MRTLPHIVIACGAVWAGDRLLRSRSAEKEDEDARTRAAGQSSIDYRLVAMGSVLPDAVDRVVRRLANGRWTPHHHLIGHTLLFGAGLLAPGIVMATGGRDMRLLSVGVAALSHLLVDPVVREPQTLFWPALGTGFTASRPPSAIITAVTQVGAALVAGLVVRELWKNRRLGSFVRTGAL